MKTFFRIILAAMAIATSSSMSTTPRLLREDPNLTVPGAKAQEKPIDFVDFFNEDKLA